MKPPYLVQRLILNEITKPLGGFDDLFSCSYMGASEFEFGALPESLKAITGALDRYVRVKVNPETVSKDGRIMWLVCPGGSERKIMSYIPKLMEKGALKECSYLKESLEGSPDFRFDAWWDVDNHWILVLGEKNSKRTMEALQALRKRWVIAGKIAR